MTAIFDTSLWGTNTTGKWLTCLVFTIPPASTNNKNSLTINPSGVTITSVANPSGTTWDPNTLTLTIPSTFTTASSTVTLTLSNGATGSFGLSISGSAQSGVAFSFSVNASGWMNVASAVAGVTFTGFTPLIQSIPTGGGVSLQGALFLIPKVTGTPDFSFQITNSAGTITFPSPPAGVTVNGSTVTCQSSLIGGTSVQVTVKFTPNSGSAVTSTFTLQRLSASSLTSGGTSSLALAADGDFNVAVLASGAYLRGDSVQFYAKPGGATDFLFYIATGPITFNSQSVSIGTPGSTFSSSVPTTGPAEITDTGTKNAQTSFTLATTNGGTWDPTIINDPDSGPIPVSDTRKTDT